MSRVFIHRDAKIDAFGNFLILVRHGYYFRAWQCFFNICELNFRSLVVAVHHDEQIVAGDTELIAQ